MYILINESNCFQSGISVSWSVHHTTCCLQPLLHTLHVYRCTSLYHTTSSHQTPSSLNPMVSEWDLCLTSSSPHCMLSPTTTLLQPTIPSMNLIASCLSCISASLVAWARTITCQIVWLGFAELIPSTTAFLHCTLSATASLELHRGFKLVERSRVGSLSHKQSTTLPVVSNHCFIAAHYTINESNCLVYCNNKLYALFGFAELRRLVVGYLRCYSFYHCFPILHSIRNCIIGTSLGVQTCWT